MQDHSMFHIFWIQQKSVKIFFCHNCEANHEENMCSMKNTLRWYCAVCKTKGHKRWQRICPAWEQKRVKSSFIYHNKLQRFSCDVSSTKLSTMMFRASNSFDESSIKSFFDFFEWQIIIKKKWHFDLEIFALFQCEFDHSW